MAAQQCDPFGQQVEQCSSQQRAGRQRHERLRLNAGPGRVRVMLPDSAIKAMAALARRIQASAGIGYLTLQHQMIILRGRLGLVASWRPAQGGS